MKKGRILFVRSFPSNINFSTYNTQQIGMGRAFCDKGYDFDFFTFNTNSNREVIFYKNGDCSARYKEFRRKRIFNWGINFSLCKSELINSYDLIICFEYYQIMTYLISRKTDKAVLYAGPYWNMFLLKFMSPIYDAFFTKELNKKLNVKFVKSSIMKTYLEKKGYSNVFNVGVALDVQKFENQVIASAETLKLIEYMKENPCLLYVGRIDPNKNVSFLLKVFEKILEERPETRFVIIGKDYTPIRMRYKNKSYKDIIWDSIPETVRNRIYHLETINNSELKYIYPIAKCLLLASLNEVFGMVLLEAMYLGAPVVSSENGGSTTLITSDDFGQIVKEFDVDQWKNAVFKYLDDEKYTDNVKKNARNRILSEFTWDVLVDKIISVSREHGLLT